MIDEKDLGRYLPRGGRKVEVTKTGDAFTAMIGRPSDVDTLRAQPTVEAVVPVTRSVVRVQLQGGGIEEAVQSRDDIMSSLRERGMVIHHEYEEAGNESSKYQITDEILVKFKPGVSTERIGEIFQTVGVVIKKPYPSLGQAYLVRVTEDAAANPIKVANRLENYDEVEYAEPSIVNRLAQFAFPTDDQFPFQWHLYSGASREPDIAPSSDAGVYAAWQITKGSRDVVLAVLDDGFDLSHPDFMGAGKVVDPIDFRGGDDNPLPEATDYHGTPCAGVAIAEENGVGCVGAAPTCAFMPVRFPLNAPDPWIIEVFEYVSQRAHIASCSWGLPPGPYDLNSAVRETLSRLARTGGKDGKGLTMVFAAGNYDAPVNATVGYTITWLGQDAMGRSALMSATGRIVNGFAAHPDVIAVSACTSLRKKALYSNWGPEVSVAAPSSNYNPTTNSPLPGRAITTTYNQYFGQDFAPGKRYTNSFGGTSSAAPLVAGIAALVKSANINLSSSEIKAIIEQTADKIEDLSIDPLYGNAGGTYASGRSNWFGSGKVNALRAVQAATARASQPPAGPVTVRKGNAGNIPIPDNFAPGVRSFVTVGQSGLVAQVEVGVSISHEWSGDLEITLISPKGTRTVLQSRSGAGAPDVRRTFTEQDTRELSALHGETVRGAWTLQVADLAPDHLGILQSWYVEIQVTTSSPLEKIIEVNSDNSLMIPDNNTQGITSPLTVNGDGVIKSLEVSVDITHLWIGDLLVSLVPPTGQEVMLHNREGGDTDNIRRVYTPSEVPGLAALIGNGQRSSGVWKLKVADVAQGHTGKLSSWSLRIETV